MSALTALRASLAGLTTRGRCLLAAGLTLAACAVVLGQRDLLRIAVFLVALPLAAVAIVSRTRYRLACSRALDPPRVEAGRPSTVRLRLDNVSRLPSGVLLMEDALPYALGGRPRFVLDKVEPRGVREVTYPVRSDVRGRYAVGPLSVRLTDPFGLCELARSFASSDDLVVTPVVSPLPPVRLGGDWTGGGDAASRSVAVSGTDDAATREYRYGDDLRKVHWRSTARVGELMVRREEQPWQSRATLFLDNRKIAHAGSGAASSLEHAVVVAASIGVHLVQRGFNVRLVTAAGEETAPQWHEHGAHGSADTAPLLESLAVVTEVSHPHIDVKWLQDGGHSGLLIGVLGAVAEHDQPAFTRMRHSAAAAMAYTLDVSGWGRASAGPVPAVPWLTAHGWRAVSAGPRDPVPQVWQELGLLGRTRNATRGPDLSRDVS